jgi:hypothetical protein
MLPDHAVRNGHPWRTSCYLADLPRGKLALATPFLPPPQQLEQCRAVACARLIRVEQDDVP